MTQSSTVDLIIEQGVVPVFSNADHKVNCEVVRACAEGGARLFEFTNRIDDAVLKFEQLRKIVEAEHPDLVLGAGTIRTLAQAKQFFDAGAKFLVGPNYSEEVAQFSLKHGVPYSPGCMTPTELEYAQATLGKEALIKVFPGSSVGPGFVRSVLATNPTLRLMITGGVKPDRDSLKSWFDSGALAVGMGSEMLSKQAIAESRWTDITEAVSNALKLAIEVRGA